MDSFTAGAVRQGLVPVCLHRNGWYTPDWITEEAFEQGGKLHARTFQIQALAVQFDWDQMGPVLEGLVQDESNRPATDEELLAGTEFARQVLREPENGDLWGLAFNIVADQKLLPRNKHYGRDAERPYRWLLIVRDLKALMQADPFRMASDKLTYLPLIAREEMIRGTMVRRIEIHAGTLSFIVGGHRQERAGREAVQGDHRPIR